MIWLRRYRGDVMLVLLIIGLAAAVFIFFKSIFDQEISDLTVEILAALLGTILTVMITMLLIKRQGSIEQAQEAAATSKTLVFEKKLELFREFIGIYVKSAVDGELDVNELEKLEELALVTSLFTRDHPIGSQQPDLGEDLCRFVFQLELFGLRTDLREEDYPVYDKHLGGGMNSDDSKRRLRSFVHILQGMKIELGIGQSGSEEDDESMWETGDCAWTRRLLNYRDYRGEVSEV